MYCEQVSQTRSKCLYIKTIKLEKQTLSHIQFVVRIMTTDDHAAAFVCVNQPSKINTILMVLQCRQTLQNEEHFKVVADGKRAKRRIKCRSVCQLLFLLHPSHINTWPHKHTLFLRPAEQFRFLASPQVEPKIRGCLTALAGAYINRQGIRVS